MKKVLCVLIILIALWGVNFVVFADPHGEPGTETLIPAVTLTDWD